MTTNTEIESLNKLNELLAEVPCGAIISWCDFIPKGPFKPFPIYDVMVQSNHQRDYRADMAKLWVAPGVSIKHEKLRGLGKSAYPRPTDISVTINLECRGWWSPYSDSAWPRTNGSYSDSAWPRTNGYLFTDYWHAYAYLLKLQAACDQ